ncbi:MAG TPA: rhodanese-like domain-containing protein [candidate division Zixibacteria bacterium]|jgi:rhodanese-related sulfurtransferase
MKQSTSRQILFLLSAAVVLGLLRNAVAPGSIPWRGQWGPPQVAPGDSTGVPQSAQPDDPPFITLQKAAEMHADPNVVFIDARDPEDFEMGCIPGSILLPFEMFDDYWPAVSERLSQDRPIVAYCSGSECEASLMLARLLVQEHGYEHVYVFFGGATMWEDAGMPMDTIPAPPPGV